MYSKDKKQFQVQTFLKTVQSNPKHKETNSIIHQVNQKQNHNSISKFERLQPEIIYQISEFLTYEQYLQLRLVNSFMNQRIQYISTLKLQSMNQKIQYFEKQLYEQVKSNENYQNQEYEFKSIEQKIKQQISTLNKASMLEVRAYNNPPQIIQKIFGYLMILLNFQIKIQENIWKQIREFLSKPFNVVDKLEQITIRKITQSQLKKLIPILEISAEQANNISSAAGIICLVIQQIIKANNCCQLIIQQENIENEIKINLNKQAHLNKIIGINKN